MFSNAVLLGDKGGLSVQHERIAEIINDLDPNLELAYIPEPDRSAFDKHPFMVRHKNGYVVMTLAANEVDHRVIAKLIKRDTARGSVIDAIDSETAAYNLVHAKSQMDEMDEKRDFAHHVLKSNKNVYRHNGATYRS